jgi:hypothetical protein
MNPVHQMNDHDLITSEARTPFIDMKLVRLSGWRRETRISIESMEERRAYIRGGKGCWLYA